MPRNSRNCINTTFFHIMVQGLNKEYIFNNDEDKKQYLKFIKKIKKDTEHLKEIIIILKNNYNLSLRKISMYINVGRETVRIIAKEL